MTDNNDDPVTVGIREWQKVKQASEDAIARANDTDKRAAEEVAYYKGQVAILEGQHKADVERARMLQQHHDEMSLMVDALGSAVLSIIEKRKAGFFRKAGSERSEPLRARAVAIKSNNDGGLDQNLRELARSISGNKPAEPNWEAQRKLSTPDKLTNGS